MWVETHDPSPEPFPQHVGDKTEPRLNRCQKQENAEKWCRSRSKANNLVKIRNSLVSSQNNEVTYMNLSYIQLKQQTIIINRQIH